jgi:hypothetical protein
MLTSELKEALSGDRTPKFLGTADRSGRPNCVPVTTITPYDDHTLVFGEFMMNKSRKNLLECAKVGIAVITESFESWTLKGTFLGFESTGAHVEFINRSRPFRYNAYTSIRAAGIIRVEQVSPKRTMAKVRLLSDYLRVSIVALLLRGNTEPRRTMHRNVVEKFSRLSAVRAIGHLAPDGYPHAFATVVCLPASPNRLLVSDPFFNAHKTALEPGLPVAVSVITRDPIAYQVKGHYAGEKLGVGVIEVTECYSASPPLCGERLDTIPQPSLKGSKMRDELRNARYTTREIRALREVRMAGYLMPRTGSRNVEWPQT